ncbi:hypothetical protein CIK75_07520 [Glutamicibacter sp. BW78]|uniref:glycosyltransferase n=1 Tax=Glutamicibacter sp. BW78 TaxID=2024403 RepID=UPI000BB82232|nr:glycosyltransferase [Glutamicibacter sp. BW78]PCC25515.1 hypothetical protein CIK75_07520 [Glutamicibacter sp. BW78]
MSNIPLEFGGMVNSMLRRINGFVQYGHHPSVTILTINENFDAESTRQRLVEQNKLEESVKIRNAWTDLRAMSDDDLRRFVDSCAENTNVTLRDDNSKYSESRERLTATAPGTNSDLRKRFYRDDGSLLGVQISTDTADASITLCSTTQTPLAEFKTIEDLYVCWIKNVIEKDKSLLIVDDKMMSEFLCEIVERDFKMVLFMHGSHLRRPYDGPYGESLAKRTNTMRNIERFDFIATQTRQQAAAMAAKGIAPEKLRHLPSELSFSPNLASAHARRDELSGVIIARLSKLKRVNHAISAIAEANELGAKTRLTVFGKGPELESLRNYSRKLEVEESIKFAGHVADLPSRLEKSSFSLLTSMSEGLGLAVIESMAVGCVPITYDINYGPRDIIDNGVDGFVVPFGDTNALAASIVNFLSLTADEKLKMRVAAIEKAASYLPRASYARWLTAIGEVATAKDPLPLQGKPTVKVDDIDISEESNSVCLNIQFADGEYTDARRLQMLLASRKTNTFLQSVGIKGSDDKSFNFPIPYDYFSQSKGQTFNVFVRFDDETWNSKRRLVLPESFEMTDSKDLLWYRTKYGNFSVKIASAN